MTHLTRNTPSLTLRRLLLLCVPLLFNAACGGGGADVVPLPVTNPPPVAQYNGPAPSTADVQSFKINVWDNVSDENRCGACHVAGGQTPTFARQDDVNLAYSDANPIVNLTDPNSSLMVTKVAGGHNCWLSSPAACADILTTWISAWAGDAIAGGGNQIDLEAPVLKEIGQSKTFPATADLFVDTVYPVLTTYCAGCHNSGATTPQQPYFADADADAAYEAVRAKINLDDTDDSRLVLRLLNEFHNCWSDCASDGAMMLTAIDDMAGQILPTQVDPALVTSKALTLFDGTVASGGNRYDNNVIALYEFKTGSGLMAFDTSGVEPAINLALSGDVSWFGGWGIDIRGGKAQGSTASSAKLHQQITATGEYSIEAWAVPGNVTQEEARIVSYSAGVDARNFTLGQTLYNYDFMNRSSVTDANGGPALSTADADEDLQATLQHVVMTFDPVNGRQIFVNGSFTDDVDADGGGLLNDWDDTFALVLGNEVSGDRGWSGVLRLVAIHNRALTNAQIVQNFEAGVGEKFFLLFNVSELINVPDSYFMFEVSQFDSYSYLFRDPTFISLDANAQPDGIDVQGLRIGVNGRETQVGQAYKNLAATISAAQYTPAGQLLSSLGTIVPLEKGPESDEFFLSFELLGNNTNVVVEATPTPPATPANGDPQPTVGLRTFDEINASMAAVTRVSMTQADVRDTFVTIRQQLPSVDSIGGFLSSHQVAVAQLAIEYCNALVEDDVLRASYFPGVAFDAPASTAFASSAQRDLVLDPLLTNVVGVNLLTQPDATAVKAELNSLIDRLTVCGNACAADRTEVTVKAVCAGALGSAAVVLQ